jgi:hypothetical protein
MDDLLLHFTFFRQGQGAFIDIFPHPLLIVIFPVGMFVTDPTVSLQLTTFTLIYRLCHDL